MTTEDDAIIFRLQSEVAVLKMMLKSMIVNQTLTADDPREALKDFLTPLAVAQTGQVNSAETPREKEIAQEEYEALQEFGDDILSLHEMLMKEIES